MAEPAEIPEQAKKDAAVILRFMEYQQHRGKLGYGMDSTSDIPVAEGSAFDKFIKIEQAKAQSAENELAKSEKRAPHEINIKREMDKALDIGWQKDRGGSSLDINLQQSYQDYLEAGKAEKSGQPWAGSVKHAAAERVDSLLKDGKDKAIDMVQKKRDECANPHRLEEMRQMLENYERFDKMKERQKPKATPRPGGAIEI